MLAHAASPTGAGAVIWFKLYARARHGEIRNFTGIDDPYEPPEKPDVVIDTTVMRLDEAVAKVVEVWILLTAEGPTIDHAPCQNGADQNLAAVRIDGPLGL